MTPLAFLEQIYATHGVLIDFALFCALFIALAVEGLSKFMPGRQGKAVAVVVGILLAAALSQFVQARGYSIVSLGPLAIAVLILLVAGTAFHVCKRLHIGNVGATVVAVVVALLLLDEARVVENVTWLAPLVELLVILAVPFLLLDRERSPRPVEVAENPRRYQALADALEQQKSLMTGAYVELGRLRAEVGKGRKSSAPQLGLLAQRIRATDQALMRTTRLIAVLVRRLKHGGGPPGERVRLLRRIREYEKVVRDGASIASSHILLAQARLRAGDFDAAGVYVDKATEHVQGLVSIERDIRDLARELRVLPVERH